jgi:hypothetical protein
MRLVYIPLALNWTMNIELDQSHSRISSTFIHLSLLKRFNFLLLYISQLIFFAILLSVNWVPIVQTKKQ